ncbi:PREDICTED: protein MMS22-like [Nanorana parkeri]|uniref:protein MMS22-like n=1 Tax=Nanorana parkeri TaxID=125878 RepID=UPI000854C580|nr:PREDICTED: protein MMS22-like [Nanorana parkeri]
MSEELAGSLTPPFSPYFSENPEPGGSEHCKPLRFSCAQDSARDGGKSFPFDSYLTSGSLRRLLLKLDPSPTDYETDTVEIFGFQWVTETALVESTDLLFGLLRQKINALESLSQPLSFDFGQVNNVHYEADEIRSQCLKFLHYVKIFIYRFLDSPKQQDDILAHPFEEMGAQFPSKLIEELHCLGLHIGPLWELPSTILGAFTIHPQSKVFPASWHLLHLYLDIHWSILEILQILGEKMQGQIVYAHQFINLFGKNLTNMSLFEEHCENLICGLIALAAAKYFKVRPSEAFSGQFYPCMCIKEMWVLVIQLVDHRSKASSSENFWGLLSILLRKLLQGSGGSEVHDICNVVKCKDTLGLCWWIVAHLSPLYQLDRNGNLDEHIQISSNWKFVEELLKKSINVQTGILEDQLRMYLQCCLSLCDLWEANLTAATILWDYYSKNLNSLFNISWLGLKSLASVSKTPFSMLEKVKSCCADENHPDLYKSDNSYLIFLRIIARLMKKAKQSSGIHPWKQIKGRIYSKFHQKKMQELSEVGLQNFFTLFLLLATLAETEDVTSRVLDLLHFLIPGMLNSSQKTLVWRGYFAFILIYVEKNMDIGVLAEKLSNSFRETAKEFLVCKGDYGQKHTHWSLLSTYVDGAQEVFETSSFLQLSEDKLLNDGFSMLLPACRESELSAVLHFLQTAVSRLRNIHSRAAQGHGNAGVQAQALSVAKERHLAVASALWRNFFPFLKSLRLSQTPPSQLADTAAGYTLLALDIPGSAPPELQPQPFVSMMQLFGWDDMITTQLVSRYLSHLIANRTLTEALNDMGNTTFQTLSVRTWSRCVLQMYVDQPSDFWLDFNFTASAISEQLRELTRLVFKLPEVENMFVKAQIEAANYMQDPKTALLQFFKVVGIVYSGLQTLSEKSTMVTKCLEYSGDILKYVKPYLTKKGPVEGLQITYRTVGYLVRYWASILATSKAQQLLFRIIDYLLLPHALFQQDKGLPAAMLTAVMESLPLFLQGLSIISRQSQVQAAYVKQQLKTIIEQYFGRFLPSAPQAPTAGSHPILLALCDSVQSPHTVNLRKTVTQIINDSYLQFKGQAPPPRLASVLSFIVDVFQRTKTIDVSDAQFLLPAILKCMILVHEPLVRKLSIKALQHIIEGCREVPQGEAVSYVTCILRQFIQEYLWMYDHQIFGILETLSILDQSLVVDLIPTISESLMASEHKRGLGRNAASREAYKRLLSHLGELGQNELQALENERPSS